MWDVAPPGDDESRVREKDADLINMGEVNEFLSTAEKPKEKDSYPSIPSVRAKPSPPRLLLFVIWALIISGGFLGLAYYRSYDTMDILEKNASNLESAARKTKLFEFGGDALKSADLSPKSATQYFLVNFWPIIKSGGTAIKSLQELTAQFVIFSEKMDSLGANLADFIVEKRGGELIKELEDIKITVDGIRGEAGKLRTTSASFKELVSSDLSFFLPFELDTARFSSFLDALLSWLKSPDPHNLVILFQNSSELRPTGGFIGSYAHLTILGGNIENIDIRDINDPDRELHDLIIPPEPLKLVSTNWRAADANWFFNFPDSASKVLELMTASKLYRSMNPEFEGAIAITPKVLEDILGATGPISIPEYNLTLDKDNFLKEIQKYIQEAQVRKSGSPKKILGKVVPLLTEKIAALSGEEKRRMADAILGWLNKKDMMVYFKNEPLQQFLDYYGWTGKMMDVASDSSSDYLAIVSSNIEGEKSDMFMAQDILLESQINGDGTVNNYLSIIREHRAKRDEPWWYTAASQSYIKVFAMSPAELTHSSGGIEKKIVPRVRYEPAKYATDPLVRKIESSRREYIEYPEVQRFEEAGKTVFATWSKVKAREKAKITLDYTRRLVAPLQAGGKYRFIFEKQAGVRGSYHFEISAPLGFKWQENGLPTFEYTTDDPEGRVTLDLTLAKN